MSFGKKASWLSKILAESFRGVDHLWRINTEAQTMIDEGLATAPHQPEK
jgi:hypothetical protein